MQSAAGPADMSLLCGHARGWRCSACCQACLPEGRSWCVEDKKSFFQQCMLWLVLWSIEMKEAVDFRKHVFSHWYFTHNISNIVLRLVTSSHLSPWDCLYSIWEHQVTFATVPQPFQTWHRTLCRLFQELQPAASSCGLAPFSINFSNSFGTDRFLTDMGYYLKQGQILGNRVIDNTLLQSWSSEVQHVHPASYRWSPIPIE